MLSVGGDIWSDSGFRTSDSNDAKVILNGSKGQTVYLHGGRINELEIQNSAKRTVIWSGFLSFNKLIGDTQLKANGLYLDDSDMNRSNLVINGDVSLTGGTVNLNGGSLTINGNLLQSNGTITCNNGTLNVNGNYTIENTTTNNVGETVYNSCDANLRMENQYDKVNISGNFTTHSLCCNYTWNYGFVYLTSGVLSVGGDIWSDSGFRTSDSNGHRTILSGNKKQKITLNDSDKFNILVVTKPISNYTFNPDNCWNTLIMAESGTGDANLDGETTVVDVILLQKYLHNKQTINKAQWMACDMNGDGKVNVFDLALLKRKLLKKS